MIKGLVISNQTIGHSAYKIKRFKEEFNKIGLDFDVYINDGTLVKIINNQVIINLPKAQFVIYLDKDMYLATLLEKNGYRLFNKPDFINLCDDKMLTAIRLANTNIHTINTIPCPLVYEHHIGEDEKFLKHVENTFGYPLILKRVYGSLGEGVFLINNYKELKNAYRKFKHEKVLFQEYIKTSYGKSLRVLIVNHQVVGSFIRKNDADFRSNFGKTAYSLKAENVDNFIDAANKIVKELNIEYAGIDFLFGENDTPILCEINSNAFFEEFEKTTKINVAKLFGNMVKLIIEEGKNL